MNQGLGLKDLVIYSGAFLLGWSSVLQVNVQLGLKIHNVILSTSEKGLGSYV